MPAPVVAVSPIIAGQAVKGPTAKMMAELGLPVDAGDPARHYRDFLDLYVADEADAAAVAGLDLPVVLTRTLMHNLADREALARAVLAAADSFGNEQCGIWAVVPVKDTAAAKQRLAPALPRELRQELALAMLEDVLAALAEARDLAGVSWSPPTRRRGLAARYGAECWTGAPATAIPARSRQLRAGWRARVAAAC